METIGQPRDFAAEGFQPRDHLELGEMLGAIDMERGAKVSGSRFYFLTGVGAQLEFALSQFAMAKALEWGFTPMIPPSLVKPSAMEGTGFLGQAAQDVYHLADDDLYLVGTSEVPLAGYHSGEIVDFAAGQGHPRHLPGALVRQVGDVRLLRPGAGRGRAPEAAGLREGVHHRPGAALPGAGRGLR